LTQEEDILRILALAIFQLGGHLEISKQLLDDMLPVRLVLDVTSQPDRITVAVISNEVIMLTVEKPDVASPED
jgi:hypothetical protein